MNEVFTSSIYESAISTTTNTAMQSLFNNDTSFKDTLKNQLINTSIGALGNLGAKEIGLNYHNGNLEMGLDGTWKHNPNNNDNISNQLKDWLGKSGWKIP